MSTTDSSGLRRILGPIDATCIVVGAVIGVGIFFTPARIARQTGTEELAFLAWAIGGFIALLGALTYAELGSAYSRSGAQYEILRDAYGPYVGFLFVFCNSTASLTGTGAIIAIICSRNLGVMLHGAPPDLHTTLLISTVLIGGLNVANIIGVRWGASIQNATVLSKIATLLLITTTAFLAGGGTSSAPAGPIPTTGATGTPYLMLVAAMVSTHFTYGGWQHALWATGEIRNPQRNVPLAIIGGMVLVVVCYLLVNWAYLHLLGVDGMARSQALAADAVAQVWPTFGMRVVAGAVALSAFGVLNSQYLSGPRLLYGLAVDGRFFKPFRRVSGRFATPYPAILLIGLLSLGLLYAASFGRDAKGAEDAVDRLLTGVVLIDGLFYLLTGLAVPILRRKRPDLARSVRVPGYPVVPLLYVLGEVAVVAGAYCDQNTRSAAHIGFAWLIAASICYLLFFSDKARRRAAA